MPNETKRVIVAVGDDTARAAIVQNLEADGHVPLAATSLQHTCSRLDGDTNAVVVELGADTTKLIDCIRGGFKSVDAWLPIVAITGGNDPFHSVRLLERGADQVISEPWMYLQVRAHLAAALRRVDAGLAREVLRAGALKVDVRSRAVWLGSTEIDLTAREYDLLRILISDPDRVFTRSELLAGIWGLGDWARSRTLDSHASRLRRRLNEAGGNWVRNVWGVGYRLTDGEFHPMQEPSLRGSVV
jgi:DNA-binding response OmpR family regulator